MTDTNMHIVLLHDVVTQDPTTKPSEEPTILVTPFPTTDDPSAEPSPSPTKVRRRDVIESIEHTDIYILV